MTKYPDLDELDRLWPDEGYAIIIEDEWKPPDSNEFVKILRTYDSPDFELLEGKNTHSYWVHDANGNKYFPDEWAAFRTLIGAVETVVSEYPVEEKLQSLKEKGDKWWVRDDVIWFEIALSLATLQGSYGSQIVVDEDGQIDEHRYGSVAFGTLEQVDSDLLYSYLESRLYGNVAMHRRKAEAFEKNLHLIKEKYRHPEGAKQAFMEKEGQEGKMEFLKQFELIGDKYARNIPMDLYLEDFREYIAIDSRIEGILKETSYRFERRRYDKHEQFLQAVANELEMEPWELDRTLYHFEDEIHEEL